MKYRWAWAVIACMWLGLYAVACRGEMPLATETMAIVPSVTPTPGKEGIATLAPSWTPWLATPTPDLTRSPLPDTPTSAPTKTPLPPTVTATATVWPTVQADLALTAPALVAEVAVGELPGFGQNPVALELVGDTLYVANMDTANVSLIRDDRVIKVLPVGASPVALAADPITGETYVLNLADQSLTVLADGQVVRTVPTGQGAQDMAWTPAGLVISLAAEGRVVLLDPATGAMQREYELGINGVRAVAVDQQAGVILLNEYGRTWAIDLETGQTRYLLEMESYVTMACDAQRGLFFLTVYDAAANQQYLTAVRTADGTVLERVPVGQDPRGAAVNERTGLVYVANSWSNDVTVVQGSPLRVVATIPVGMRPTAVAVDQERNLVYVANGDGDNVAVIDGASQRLLRVIPLAVRVESVAVDERTGRAYVAVSSDNSVVVIEHDQVVATWPVGLHPTALAVDASRGLLFVANQADGTARVLDAATGELLTILAVGGQPQAAAVDAQAGLAYVGRAVIDSDMLRVVSELQLSAVILEYDIEPTKMVVDVESGRLYVQAFNGIPGSNGGDTVYALDGRTHAPVESDVSLGAPGVTDFALDAKGGHLYVGSARFGSNGVYLNNLAEGGEPRSLALWKYPSALAYNAATDHLFLGLTRGSRPDVDQGHELVVLDGALNEVLLLPFPGIPSAMAVDGARNRVYICDRALGKVFVLQDVP